MKEQNYVKVDLTTNQTTCGEITIPDEKINASATILANILLDFMRNGGNLNELTPSTVFGQRSKQ